jgi:uncharacterized membrane protein YbhN (UPF0104 family)
VPEQAQPRRRADLLALGFVLVMVGIAGFALWDDLPSIGDAMARIAWWRVVAAAALVIVGLLTTAEVWRLCLAALGSTVSAGAIRRIFFPAQIGKYLPGAVWPFLAQMRLARQYGIPGPRALMAGAMFMAIHMITAVLVSALLLVSQPTLVDRLGWTAVLAPVALILIHPRVVSAIARKVDRSGEALPELHWPDVLRPMLWMAPAWVCYGAACWILADAFSAPTGRLAAVGTGAFALSWLIGVVIVIAPAGVGAREAVIGVMLAPLIGTGAAASVGILLRVCHTVADVGLALGFGFTAKAPSERS